MGHPVLRSLVQALHIAVLPRQPHLAQSRRIFGTQARIAANPALGSRACQPGLGALADQRPFELGRGPQDLEGELALRGCRIDRVLQRTEEGALGLQPLDQFQQMRQRSRQPVDPHDHQRIALADPLQHPGQHRPRTVAARGLLFMDLGAACQTSGPATGAGGSDPRWRRGHSRSAASNGPFAISGAITKRPFVNECKGGLCGAAQQKPLGFHTASTITGLSQTVARACYIRCHATSSENPLVMCKIIVFCTYEASSPFSA